MRLDDTQALHRGTRWDEQRHSEKRTGKSDCVATSSLVLKVRNLKGQRTHTKRRVNAIQRRSSVRVVALTHG